MDRTLFYIDVFGMQYMFVSVARNVLMNGPDSLHPEGSPFRNIWFLFGLLFIACLYYFAATSSEMRCMMAFSRPTIIAYILSLGALLPHRVNCVIVGCLFAINCAAVAMTLFS